MDQVSFNGWKRNARIVCQDVEMIVTLEVGPRIIFLGFIGGENMFFVNPPDAGKTGGDQFRGYGGHRLWIAPEEPLRTLQPDNAPVQYREEDGFHVFSSAPDKFSTRKEMRIRPEADSGRFVILHRVYNHSPYDLALAAWSPTQCSGGVVLFPQAPHATHDERLLPTRPLVMWGYTKISDPRWTWGDRLVRLRHDPNMGPTKLGSLVEQGYAACANRGNLFLKRFACQPDQSYPDFNCNFETFTRQDMLEIESLGPMVSVPAGGYVEHQETWYLLRNQMPPAEDGACADWLADIASARPL